MGGLVGTASNGSEIDSCYAIGSVTGTDYVGGLAGDIYEANVKNCYADVEVTGRKYVGGFAGFITSWKSNGQYEISNNYAKGNVSYTELGAGFVGYYDKVYDDTKPTNLVNNIWFDSTGCDSAIALNETGQDPTNLIKAELDNVNSSIFEQYGFSESIWDFSGDTPTLKNVGLVKENVSTKALEKPISVTAQEGATSNFESLVGF